MSYSEMRRLARNKKRRRGTYTETNALSVKPVFDIIIASNYKAEQIIPYESFPYNTPKTVYVKVCDALAWLCEYFQPSPEQYMMLKNNYRITHEVNANGTFIGVGLRRKIGNISVVTSMPITNVPLQIDNGIVKCDYTPVGEKKIVSWRDVVTDYIQNLDAIGKPMKIELSLVGEFEINWLNTFFSGCRAMMDVDYIVEGKTITIMKEAKQ
jgi:hypothetical protein